MRNEEYKMLSGMDLALMAFPEERFCIQDILPKGLVILSSEMVAPARSLAMDMCLRVVNGDKLWKMEAGQGAALYMIHQNDLATTRNLIMDMTSRVPDDLYVGVMTENSLALALEGVESFVRHHSNAALAVIEANAQAEQYENAVYVPDNTVQQYIALKEFALAHGIAVVVILCSECYPVVRRKSENMICITDKADGHIDMCILDGDDREALIQVDVPLRAPRLWNVKLQPKLRRWVEENEADGP